MELKSRGSYVARRLDFSKSTFSVRQIETTSKDKAVYNSCVDVWNFLKSHIDEFKDKDSQRELYKFYWKEHQIFFKLLCLSFKTKPLVAAVK